MLSQALTDEQLDALLEADEAAHADNALAIFARIHERRRKRAHSKAKQKQPPLYMRGTSHKDKGHGTGTPNNCPCYECVSAKVQAFWKSPLTAEDADANTGAMDYLLQTVADVVETGDAEDVIFAALRVARKAWAWNIAHLGPIEGIPTQPKAGN